VQLLLSSVDAKIRGSIRPTSSRAHNVVAKYSRTSLIRTLVIRITNYPDRLRPSGKHFLSVTVLRHFMAYISPLPRICNRYKEYVIMFYLFVNMQPKRAVCRIFFPLHTANVACFQKKIQLSGFSAYPDGSPSQLIRINGVLLYLGTEHRAPAVFISF
jgi:hypothetical protein